MKKGEIRELLKPIKDGFLTGKSNAYKRPEYKLRDLGTMLEDLSRIEMLDWYKYAFSREPLNGKFTDEQRRTWMEQSIECGQEYCRLICKKYSSNDPVSLAKSMGLKVSYPALPEGGDRILFAEYRMPNQISIFMDAVRKANRLLENPEVSEVMTGKLNISKLLLAHELFHCVEDQYKKEIFTQNEKIRLWSIGPFHNDSLIIALSEIAAMAFAKEMTRIPYAPYLMDVLLVYGYSPMEASGLYEEMMGYAGLEPCSSENKEEEVKR